MLQNLRSAQAVSSTALVQSVAMFLAAIANRMIQDQHSAARIERNQKTIIPFSHQTRITYRLRPNSFAHVSMKSTLRPNRLRPMGMHSTVRSTY